MNKKEKCRERVPFNENLLDCQLKFGHKGDHKVKTYVGWSQPIRIEFKWENSQRVNLHK